MLRYSFNRKQHRSNQVIVFWLSLQSGTRTLKVGAPDTANHKREIVCVYCDELTPTI